MVSCANTGIAKNAPSLTVALQEKVSDLEHRRCIDGCIGIYVLGDGAPFTRSLSQAAANGAVCCRYHQ